MKKKTFLLLFLLCGMLSNTPLQAQNVNFRRYFEDATLRIDYLRVGNRQQDSVRQVQVRSKLPVWAGSLTQLLDPFDNGDYRVVVQTPDGMALYSRCYNSLFHEYRDTPEGKDSIAAFEEVLRLPWPKHTVDICWQKRGEDHQFHTQHTYRFNPKEESRQLLRRSDVAIENQVIPLYQSGDVHQKIDVVIVPEGYGVSDTAKMMGDFLYFATCLLGQEPFHSRFADFNVWCVNAIGEHSGITDPTKGIYVNSLVGATYNTFGADRYLMTTHLFQLHDAIGSTPCDHIVIMANSTTYGGGAIYNFYAISSLNPMAPMVLPHELGHSIGGLADEYVDENLSYGDMHAPTVEPTEPNITTLVNFASKWADMLPVGTPVPTPSNDSLSRKENGPLGVYEGAGYHSKGFYRPVMHCMMRDYAPFCPVCARRLNDIFDLYTK
ncbi:MAG: peptidase M64 [Bacteroidales bacterium]|nr:peptidase M64 [Bacteroidales bacterium]